MVALMMSAMALIIVILVKDFCCDVRDIWCSDSLDVFGDYHDDDAVMFLVSMMAVISMFDGDCDICKDVFYACDTLCAKYWSVRVDFLYICTDFPS
jgi:hypothetical protein